MSCECDKWARSPQMLITRHHPSCKDFDPEASALICGLLDGIDAWARDEDGIHSDCWDAYVAACAAVGREIKP